MKVFFDEKRKVALALVEEAFKEPARTVISVQVLQEFFVNITKRKESDEVAAQLIDDFSCWLVVDNTQELFLSGLEVKGRWQLSLWDSMIVAAASQAGCGVLYTEDLNNGQDYGGVKAVNPFV